MAFPSGTLKYLVADNAKANIPSQISSTALTIPLDNNNEPVGETYDYTKFPAAGGTVPYIVTVENEKILIFERSGTNLTVYEEDTHGLGYLSGGEDGRGYDGTTPALHTANTEINLNIEQELQRQIIAAVEALVADVATRALDSAVIKKDGTVAFTGDQSMGSNKLTNVTDPTSNQDAATKNYVDSNSGQPDRDTTTRTAGEDVDGSTTPQAVYVSDGTGGRTSGRYYHADANDGTNTDAINCWGFVKGNTTTGNDDDIITNGIVDGFSGLTVGELYYLSDTAGAITTTPSSTNVQPLGRAYSATELWFFGINKEMLLSFPFLRKVFVPAAAWYEGTNATLSNSSDLYSYIQLTSGASGFTTFNFMTPKGVNGIEKVEIVFSTTSSGARTVDIDTCSAESGDNMNTNSTDSISGHSFSSTGSLSPFNLYTDITDAFNGLTIYDDGMISVKLGNTSNTIQFIGAIITFN
jgi:hypothetical protein